MKQYLKKIKESFFKASKGEEVFFRVIWFWGVLFYIVSFFLEKAIQAIFWKFFSFMISLITISYFVWHIYAIHKCKPKRKKLTKIEKKIIKQKAKQQFLKTFMKKLLLQQSWSKWKSETVITAIDLYIILHFATYVI